MTLAVQAIERVAPAMSAVRRIGSDYGRRLNSVVTTLGWSLVVLCAVCWYLAARLGWVEMAVIAVACGLLLVVTLPFLVGPTSLDVTTVVTPQRLTAGDDLTVSMSVRNRGKVPLAFARLELPIGSRGISYELPTLLPGGTHPTDTQVVATERRGVIVVGPVTSVRGDPLGVYRREVAWTDRIEVFVHPRTTPLQPLGAGLIRDLEGATSRQVSASDLSFHMLREYVPGDDLRHVHWLSSAKRGELLVRQHLDTRRSHITAIVDSNASSYRSEEDYETAISAAASVIVRALRDGYDVSFLSGSATMTRRSGRAALDACSRATFEHLSLVGVARKAANLAPDTSLLLLVTGPEPDYRTLQRAASQFGVEAARLVLRVDSTARPALRSRGDMASLTIGKLEELAAVLKWGLR